MNDITTYEKSKQRWTIIRNFENIDLDEVKLEIFHPITDEKILDLHWNAKDFFKTMVDLQYDYGR